VQQLHLVGLTTDLDGLIFSARRGAKSGGYVVELDDHLLATIADTIKRRDNDDVEKVATARQLARAAGVDTRAPRPPSHLSPRQIQARLRAGRSIDDVAAEAGVDIEWVERFAAPILAEQGQVVERAGLLTFVKPRVGESSQPLAVAVRWNLAERGVRLTASELEGAWSAYQVHEALWVIQFAYHSRGRPQVAEWELDVRDGSLSARNRLASQLAYVEKGRRRRAPVINEVAEDRPPLPQPSPSSTASAETSAPQRTARRRVASRRPAAKKATAKRAGGTKAVASASTAAKRPVKAPAKRPVKRPTNGAGATRKRPTKKAAARAAVKKSTSARRPRPLRAR
jgi:Protein of unknown function (DUF3071)